MRVSIEVFHKAAADGMKRRLRGIVPLSCLLLTCCMGETTAIARQDVESNAKAAPIAMASQQQPEPAVLAGSAQSSPQATTRNLSDVVSEGRLLLAEKSSKAGAKKSNAAPAKRLDSSKEEEAEEDEEDEEEDAEETDSPKGGAGMNARLKGIQSDFDPALRADLIEATVRGSVLTVAVSLTFQGAKDRKDLTVKYLGSCNASETWVTNYETGEKFGCASVSGFSHGQIKNGETKTLRLTFPAPKDAKTVGITLYNLGTFDDVNLRSPRTIDRAAQKGKGAGKSSGGSKSKEAEEEDEDEEEDEEEEEDSKDLAGKKRATKRAK